MDRLKKYDFLDENGHRLEDCADYQAIFSEHEAELARVKSAGIEAVRRAEQAEARAEQAEKELAGADAEIAEMRDELEDSRGTEKDAPNILCAIARLVGVYEHCQELGDDMGTMSLDAVQDLLAEKQKAEAENARLTKMVGNFASIEAGRCADSRTRNGIPLNDMCTVQGQIKAARRAVADSEVEG